MLPEGTSEWYKVLLPPTKIRHPLRMNSVTATVSGGKPWHIHARTELSLKTAAGVGVLTCVRPTSHPVSFLRRPHHLHRSMLYLIALKHNIKTFEAADLHIITGRLKSSRRGRKLPVGGAVTSAPASRWWPCRWSRQRPANSHRS